eukprot:SAG31_NODE_36875_length_309_cov_0.990476_1_plen_55_part_10
MIACLLGLEATEDLSRRRTEVKGQARWDASLCEATGRDCRPDHMLSGSAPGEEAE